MKASDLLDMIGEANDELIEDARKTRKKKNVWVKWVIAAACLCFIAITVGTVLKRGNKETDTELMKQLSNVGILAESIANPTFVSLADEPEMTPDELLEIIRNHTTVQGTIKSVDTVRITAKDAIWFITTAKISVDEVLCGKCESDMISIVDAVCYKGESLETSAVPLTSLYACEENSNGVFVLKEWQDEAWKINGVEVAAKEFGDDSVVCYLKKSGDTLVYPNQNISVSLEECCR